MQNMSNVWPKLHFHHHKTQLKPKFNIRLCLFYGKMWIKSTTKYMIIELFMYSFA